MLEMQELYEICGEFEVKGNSMIFPSLCII